jgi:hypothetical protein
MTTSATETMYRPKGAIVKRGLALKNWRNGYERPNPERNRELTRLRAKKSRLENRKLFRELKATLSCGRCGESHPATLDFHHRDPSTKSLEVSIMVWNRTWKRVLAEIAKCDVICANCHRKEHWNET